MWTLFKLTFLYNFLILLTPICGKLSNERLCADPECKDIISTGFTKINYPAGEEGYLSFKINAQVRIKSKSAGDNPDLWGIEVGGREGYAPKDFIHETQIFKRDSDLKFVVQVPNIKAAETQQPILKASENINLKDDSFETTTTMPLEAAKTVQDGIKSIDNEKNKIAENLSPVQDKNVVIDGTELPSAAKDEIKVVKENNAATDKPSTATNVSDSKKLPNSDDNNIVKEVGLLNKTDEINSPSVVNEKTLDVTTLNNTDAINNVVENEAKNVTDVEQPKEATATTDHLHVTENDENESYNQRQSHEQTYSEEEIIQKPITEIPERLPTTTLDNMNVREAGLFGTILDAVKGSFLSTDKKEIESHESIFYTPNAEKNKYNEDQPFCEKVPTSCDCYANKINADNFYEYALAKILDMSGLLACLSITAVTILTFLFGYYCFCNSKREGPLLHKLNTLERSLLAAQKENVILKDDFNKTRIKLSNIENNSFGSNDMVISLKEEIQQHIEEKERLKEQITNLEKELETATDSALELNKIVADLLANQNGDESIISSVEDLQKQLNEQQNTIMVINSNLADKSRENSELQIMLAEQEARLNGEIASLQQDNDELEIDKSQLQSRLDEIKNECEEDLKNALEGKNSEIKLLQNQTQEQRKKAEDLHTRLQTQLAKIEALEDCLKTMRRNPDTNVTELINVANVRAELIDLKKQKTDLAERLDAESDGKKLAENQLNTANEELEKLKQSFHQAEKDKLEAQTRLEVLSNYFREKETQLQKELSLKEAMWLKQQGEKTDTVDRLTTMQEQIQALNSQNDALRAEIEAQIAAHKAQMGTLENHAHETYLAARQAERRYEVARSEAAALRRKLTANNDPSSNTNDFNGVPSPLQAELPTSPLMGRLPPPPFMGPQPFLGPGVPFPFPGMPPPPPFLPPGESRPPPLGRLMSPPPPPPQAHHSHHHHSHSNYHSRYSDEDYDDLDDDDIEVVHNRRRSDNESWHRNSYSPPARTYRSHSPADSRYEPVLHTYESDTDFERTASPRGYNHRRKSNTRLDNLNIPNENLSLIASSPIGGNDNKKGKKGFPSSGSENSYNSSNRHNQKGKSMV